MKNTTALMKMRIKQKICSLIGWPGLIFVMFLLLFAILQNSGVIEGEAGGIVVTFLAVIALIPLSLLGCSKSIKNTIKRFQQYVTLISTQRVIRIDDIAKHTSQTSEFVRTDIQRMIDKRLFTFAVIDPITSEVIVGESKHDVQTRLQENARAYQTRVNQVRASQIELFSYNCKACGASSRIPKSKNPQCEYCGSHINQ